MSKDSTIPPLRKESLLAIELFEQMVWFADENGLIVEDCPGWREFSGQSLEEYRGNGWLDAIHAEDRERVFRLWTDSVSRGARFGTSFRVQSKDGVWHVINSRAAPVSESEGGTRKWAGVHLVCGECPYLKGNQFQNVADSAPAMLWLKEPDGYCSFRSKGWNDFTGQTTEQALGFGWLDAVHPEDRDRSAANFLDASQRKQPFQLEYRLRQADGEYRWTIDSGRPRFSETGEVLGYVGSVIDVHERRIALDTLQESEERFRMLADNISQFTWIADETGWIFWYNQRWFDYTGTNLEEMQGWGWREVHHPDHVDRVVERWSQSHLTGQPWEDTFPLKGKDGNYRWFLSRAMPIRDAEGKVVRWFGTNTDITEQRAAEEALKEADRRKDEFLATLAHELRNPLAPIRTGLEIIKMARDDPDKIERVRQTMERQTCQLVRLIEDLLDVSRITRGKLELRSSLVRLDEVVDSAVESARNLIEEGQHQLSVQLPEEPVMLMADPNRLAQVMSNLLNNAARYTPEGGQIWIRAEVEGNELVIVVGDNGLGIPEEDQAGIFEMFVQISENRTHRSTNGLGIGLTLVKSLVKMHGGTVSLSSAGLNQGSEFSLHLPIRLPEDELSSAQQREDAGKTETSRHRVLVVDDNVAAADTLATLVQMHGHEVEVANGGLQAVECAERFHPALILMDLGMPEVSGYEAARRIRQEPWGEDIMLVAVTGWGNLDAQAQSRDAGFDAHLVKGDDPEQLAEVLSRLS